MLTPRHQMCAWHVCGSSLQTGPSGSGTRHGPHMTTAPLRKRPAQAVPSCSPADAHTDPTRWNDHSEPTFDCAFGLWSQERLGPRNDVSKECRSSRMCASERRAALGSRTRRESVLQLLGDLGEKLEPRS